ncbi:viroplasmin family protein [Jeotgalicoccus sp. WY2]|uniref:ribonuclease H1 domain-containing protein n=1 Tax=Jeotgalicoccus sp. WY2 TaxID=2708346 RepID=UPI002020F8B2|nr:ribonuclease H family protein [Jeotgalicoccus sp. WY2]
MAKFYAVRKGRRPGIYNTWAACEKAAKGFSGAEFKSFKTKAEAENFMNNLKDENKKIPEGELVSYVDGSYDKRVNKAGFGAVFIINDEVIHTAAESTPVDPDNNLWNVSAEIGGILYAVKWAIDNGYQDIHVHYDYAGLEKWYTKEWQAKNAVTQQYVAKMHEYKEHINIHFYKVAAHTGVRFNEMADELAKRAVNN